MSVRRVVANGLAWLWRRVAVDDVPEIEPVMVKHLRCDQDGVSIALSHSVVKVIAGHLATWFDAFGGTNYVTCTMVAPDSRVFTMVLYRDGQTPQRVREEAQGHLTAILGGQAGARERARVWLASNPLPDSETNAAEPRP